VIASLKTPDLDVDAERLYALSQAYRTAKKESEMFTALNTLAQSYPISKWNEEGMMAAGNYHWVELDRTKAVINYQRVLDSFPSGKYAYNCEWRIAWIAYLNRQPDADDRLTNFLAKYPSTRSTGWAATPNAPTIPRAPAATTRRPWSVSRRHTSAMLRRRVSPNLDLAKKIPRKC
jgi:outer membrane protein assembly factor BamD (BamD/ComL family)